LAKGWFVSVPDYEGPLASFTAGVMSGHAVLDSIRAVQRLGDLTILNLTQDARLALWGYSGGALAAEFAAELQVQYAPELILSGAALGGLTPNVTSVMLTVNKGYSAGLTPAAILGVLSQYPELQTSVISLLKETGPYNKTTFLSTLNDTLAQSDVAFAFQDISLYFNGGFDSLLGNATIDLAILNDGIMGYHGVPNYMPIFAYKAINDLVSPIADTDKLINEYCQMGSNILYQRNTIGGHEGEEVNGNPAAVTWLDSLLGGTYAETFPTVGCSIANVTVNITDTPFKKRNVFSVWNSLT